MNAFARVFEPLSSQGSCIDIIDINLDYNHNQMIKFIEIDKSLKLLSTFKVRELSIQNWYVTQKIFKILAENIKDI